ncbi:MAG: hypothetical protein ABI208_04010 [Ginsengibacter sp.]
MSEDALIKYQGGLIKHVGNAIIVTDKLLAISERQNIIKFLIDHPDFFIGFVSKYYPLNETLLAKYYNIWDWDLISLNETILWSEKVIDRYSPLLNWNFLSRNKAVLWDVDFLEKYQNKIEWIWLSANEAFPSSEEIVEKYFDNWDWKILSQNPGLPWKAEFVDKYKNKWDWFHLSENHGLPLSFDLIDKFLNNWNWGALSRLTTFPNQLINKYPDLVNWSSLRWNNKFQWDSEATKKYNVKGNKMGFIYTYPLNIDMIASYKNREIGLWECLSLNRNIPWSFELIEKYDENWEWGSLSLNTDLPWSSELIAKYREKWDWECLFTNKTIPWSILILNMFASKRVQFYSVERTWYNTKWDFEATTIYDYRPLWDKVFKSNIDDSIINETINEKIYAFADNKYFHKKLDEIYGEVEFVLERLEGSYSFPQFPWMFLGISYDDVFNVMYRISEFINRYSLWISNDLRTILIELNLFLNETCKSIEKNNITQMQLRAIGISIFDRAHAFKTKLNSQYHNDTKSVDIKRSLKRINQYYEELSNSLPIV